MIHKKLVNGSAWLKSLVATGLVLSTLPSHAAVMNLNNVDIREVIQAVSKTTGKNFLIDPSVQGRVTFLSGKDMDKDEMYEAFLSILQVQGLEAIETGSVIKIVPIGKARSSQVAPIVPTDPEARGTQDYNLDETITQVFKLQYISAQTAAATLTPLAGQGETRVQFNPTSNSVVITGRSQNVARLAQVVRDIDKPNNQDVEAVSLKYSVASRLAQTLRELTGAGGGGAVPGAEGVVVAPQQVRISVDDNTNSILIAGDKADRERMRALILKLDIPRTQPTDTQVVPLKYAVASQLIQTLKALQISNVVEGVAPAAAGATAGSSARQVRMAADERTNSILISGDKIEREPLLAAIAKLDVPRAQSGGTRVVPLRYAKAEELLKVLTDTSKNIAAQAAGTVAGLPSGAANPAGGGSSTATVSGSMGAEVSIQADKTSNSLIISAPAHIQNNLLRVIYQLDRRRPQVLIEAIIAEVSTNMTNRIGTGIAAYNNQGSSGNSGLVGTSNFGGLNTVLSLANGATSIPAGLLFGVASNNFGIVLDALRSDGATNILSTPTIVTMDNEEASIIVGQNVPFITGSSTSGSSTTANPFTTIERKDVGLTLKVTPQINRGKTIQMKIEQETSGLAASSTGAADLITNKRQINTNVMVEDGQIIVLGGLIQDNFTDSENKVPVLSDLPIVGKAFKQNSTNKSKQNLMAFIHPVILPDRESADAYTRSKYHTLQKQQKQSNVLQRGNPVTGNQAAVFPNIECIDGSCAEGSADDLHFMQQQKAQNTNVQRIRQNPQPQARQPQKAAPATSQRACVIGFCQLESDR
ncbi:type II secretion system secretin GspD [Thiolinea disciformis]|uniref:type II secretion system secretin GspD n=1 Tax=Thiolinea disciformis TaxID=125614 RepID=UPI00037851F2|nr:type II secretion system secretin GspD [Thiolinea disciformis]